MRELEQVYWVAVGFLETPEVARKKRPRRWRKKMWRLDLTELLSLCKGSAMTDSAYLDRVRCRRPLESS